MAIQYAPETLERGKRALRCSPFLPHLFLQMGMRSISILEIAQQAGVAQKFTRRPLSMLAAESSLNWLIEVGLLRREVDGQGLTDRFRLTPLGQEVIRGFQQFPSGQSSDQASGIDLQQINIVWGRASWGDRLQNALARWLG